MPISALDDHRDIPSKGQQNGDRLEGEVCRTHDTGVKPRTILDRTPSARQPLRFAARARNSAQKESDRRVVALALGVRRYTEAMDVRRAGLPHGAEDMTRLRSL
ncbi:hypothetical protein MMYC01_210284 [Madurella mycetomatis]|uniref:Uncharacterized protein n=1 Tax=Madurella mycetomatis TaxID=100816 RepID=A0A175VSB4_9PEZI|nr:hypothetical protein MMYC01_210284 [Madurella mycetomatis]